jgi:hypothetical protein
MIVYIFLMYARRRSVDVSEGRTERIFHVTKLDLHIKIFLIV